MRVWINSPLLFSAGKFVSRLAKSIMACACMVFILVGRVHAAAPTDLSLDNTSVAENRAVGSLVGVLATADPDIGDTHTYALVSGVPGCDGSDNALFRIRGNELQVGALLDYETRTECAVCIQTSDAGNETYGKSFTISVTNETVFVQTKLIASDGVFGDSFGESLAMDGDVVVVCADDDDDRGDASGSAYVFVKPAGGWENGQLTESAKLTASDGAAGDYFGESAGISGDVIVIGAEYDDDRGAYSGSAYVFVEPAGGWNGSLTESAKLVASDGDIGDFLGTRAAISGDVIVVGALGDDDNGTNSGSAYVFVKPAGGWSGTLTESAKLTASDAATDDEFGGSVAISGDVVVIGAKGAVVNSVKTGSAYVFVKPAGGWSGALTESAKLIAGDSDSLDMFGGSVAVDDDVIVVGAKTVDGVDISTGAAYLFERPAGGWNGTLVGDAKLFASDGGYLGNFGASVAVSGRRVLSRSENAVYLFDEPVGGWSGPATQTAKLPVPGIEHSMDVAFSGGVAVAGATRDDGVAGLSGAAYLFTNIREEERVVNVTLQGGSATPVTSSPGGINCGSECAASFPIHTVMTLTAAPDAGEIVFWSGPASEKCEPADTVCQFTLTEDTTVTVRYEAPEIWTGAPVTFAKADYADWTLEANQDRMTDRVWLTRRNNQGIFNIRNADSYGNDGDAPSGTRWSDGSAANWESPDFQTWDAWHGGSPPDKVGQPAVLWLVEENIMMDITVTSWTESDAGGGFGYERSTPDARAYIARAIAILNILADLTPVVPANEIPDINGNNRLDPVDAVYYLQRTAGLR